MEITRALKETTEIRSGLGVAHEWLHTKSIKRIRESPYCPVLTTYFYILKQQIFA